MGSESTPFSGIFDADNYKIMNAKISGTQYLGIFGYVKNATLSDFALESITVSGDKYIGILAGYSYDSSITSTSVSGSINSGDYAGGITGYAYNSTIDECENGATIGDLKSKYIGGITGYAASSHVSNSINSGSLVSIDCMGGIVGYTDSSSSVKNCYNDAQFKQVNLYGDVGGIVGYHKGTICACAMNNSINGTAQGAWNTVGTIVGYDDTDAICKYCYYLKHSVINKNHSHVGDLTWGSWSNYGAYDAYGETSNGHSVTAKLNEWVSSNSTSEETYKKWSGTIPRFEL